MGIYSIKNLINRDNSIDELSNFWNYVTFVILCNKFLYAYLYVVITLICTFMLANWLKLWSFFSTLISYMSTLII